MEQRVSKASKVMVKGLGGPGQLLALCRNLSSVPTRGFCASKAWRADAGKGRKIILVRRHGHRHTPDLDAALVGSHSD